MLFLVPSYCIPLEYYANSTFTVTEVQGYGRPVLPAPETANDPELVWMGCTDANFAGSCLQWSLECNACYAIGAGFENDLSSIMLYDTAVGCNYWVCVFCLLSELLWYKPGFLPIGIPIVLATASISTPALSMILELLTTMIEP